ncbi:TniQ family protein [Mesobacillus jeotgali]|uniref:TniQ family protein n=1 Tax=Mesobacillus jeotgali TaxID=129985 RepID=UPI0009A8351A|nr:TniQ family protein [Mesobacillus jeotgali]
MNKKVNFERSKLYNLTPKGLRTVYVESFTSYLIRIASQHNVSPGHLVNKLIGPNMDKEFLLQSTLRGGNRFYDGAKTLNGFMDNSVDTVRSLECLTKRNDLGDLTFQKWKGVLTIRELFKSSLSWCPLCIKETFETGGEDVYYPLIWTLKVLKCCVIHNCQLLNQCPQCEKSVPILHRQIILGYCPYCYVRLDKVNAVIPITKEDYIWNSFIIRNIEELFSLTNKEAKITRGNMAGNFRSINQSIFKGNIDRFSQSINVPRSTLRGWINGVALPPLEKQLRLCFKFNVSFIDIIFKPNIVVDFSNELVKKEAQHIIPTACFKFDYEIAKQKLEDYIYKENSLSMEAIALKIGYSKRVLYRNFPEMCRKLSRRHKQYQTERKKYRISIQKQKISYAYYHLTDQGIYASRRKVETFLDEPGLLREKELQDYWKELISVSNN